MTATTLTAPTTTTPVRSAKFFRTGARAGITAGAATTAVAAVAHAAGVALDVSGSTIPLAGFAEVTFVFVMVGAFIAVACSHWARRPRHTFVATTVGLTLVSFAPDVTANAAVSTRLVLMLTHIVAAAIAIPALAARFAE